jgi:membrane-associated PAP2 superfamily phosphatase
VGGHFVIEAENPDQPVAECLFGCFTARGYLASVSSQIEGRHVLSQFLWSSFHRRAGVWLLQKNI